MILKQADDKTPELARLEALLRSGRIPRNRVGAVERHLRLAQAGIKGERESAHQLDFYARDSDTVAVIHDLRLELADGRVAQVDHLLIHRTDRFYLLETKHFTQGLKITEAGEFLRWNDWQRSFEGIPSPIEQNDRHALVLAKTLESLGLPAPDIRCFVLVSDQARIDRPRKFDTAMVVKADQFRTAMQRDLDVANPVALISGMVGATVLGSLEAIGKQLVALHRPARTDWLAALGIELLPLPRQAPPQAEVAQAIVAPAKARVAPAGDLAADKTVETTTACRHCGGVDISIHSGRYGYYFRCAPCQANTTITVSCGHAGHNERLRRSGAEYFRECVDCGTSTLFFINPAP
jgi:hypothetical protein